MDKSLISVIVLTYKNFEYFKECIDSVLNQKYPKIELIISDDGSDNFDLEFISSYINQKKKYNIINVNIIKYDDNVGTVKNFNNAIKASKGNYIIGLAVDDCFYNNDVISDIVKTFIKTKALIITAYRDVYDEKFLKKIKKLPNKKEVQLLKSNKNLYAVLCKQNFISGACTYYDKEFFSKYGLFDEDYKLLEDYPKYLQCTREKCKIKFLNMTTIKYRLGGISTANNINPILKKDYETAIIKEILPFKKDTGIFINRLKKCEYYRMINKAHTYKIIMIFPEIVVYKILVKLKNKILDKFLRYTLK
ncbi:glycosyltransferase [Clostridium estertheticum]|uniref:Glycosyltransferase n=1 Tax=Clostridium estertheticum TaxID=238834 RepID=A0AA47EHW9_9CLOT|nr:glycosyltransferase [Clostridium estertheticum]MBU3155332.1 glycosyltransferase [Clostridium estertheticum]WAG60390.1 glycosyltransferase [Clostridium estertheticum]